MLLYIDGVLEAGAFSAMDWSQNGSDLIVGGFIDDLVTFDSTSCRFDGTLSGLTFEDLA